MLQIGNWLDQLKISQDMIVYLQQQMQNSASDIAIIQHRVPPHLTNILFPSMVQGTQYKVKQGNAMSGNTRYNMIPFNLVTKVTISNY